MDILSIAAGVAIGAFIGQGLDMLIHHGGWHRDATDEPGKGKRSGLIVLRDYGTGVEYVASHFGMCPRLSADGKPISHAVEPPRDPRVRVEG